MIKDLPSEVIYLAKTPPSFFKKPAYVLTERIADFKKQLAGIPLNGLEDMKLTLAQEENLLEIVELLNNGP